MRRFLLVATVALARFATGTSALHSFDAFSERNLVVEAGSCAGGSASGSCMSSCGAGSHWDAATSACRCDAGLLRDDLGACVPAGVMCSPGKKWDWNTFSCAIPCSNGMLRNANGFCQPAGLRCPSNKHWVMQSMSCEWDPCAPGEIRDSAGQCVQECPFEQHYDSSTGNCEWDDCPVDMVRNGDGVCEVVDVQCPEGQFFNHTSLECISCPPTQVFDELLGCRCPPNTALVPNTGGFCAFIDAVFIAEASADVTEGGEATVAVGLHVCPLGGDTVTLTLLLSQSAEDLGARIKEPVDSTIVFTAASCVDPVAVVVEFPPDDTVTGNVQALLTASVSDATNDLFLNTADATIPLSFLDVDVPSVVVPHGPGPVFLFRGAAGFDSAQLVVSLGVRPAADVTVIIAVDDVSVTVEPSSFTFTSTDFDQPQQFTVSAPGVDERDVVTALLTATTTDNDNYVASKGVSIEVYQGVVDLLATSASSTITEGGASVSIDFLLSNSMPVSVTVTCDITDVQPPNVLPLNAIDFFLGPYGPLSAISTLSSLPMTFPADHFVTGDATITFTCAALIPPNPPTPYGVMETTVVFEAVDVDVAGLSLTIPDDAVLIEGERPDGGSNSPGVFYSSLQFNVVASANLRGPMTVALLPASGSVVVSCGASGSAVATIVPPNTGAPCTITATDDNVFFGTRVVTVQASVVTADSDPLFVSEQVSTSVEFTAQDNDVPGFTVTLPPQITEGQVFPVTVALQTLPRPGTAVFATISSNEARVAVPATSFALTSANPTFSFESLFVRDNIASPDVPFTLSVASIPEIDADDLYEGVVASVNGVVANVDLAGFSLRSAANTDVSALTVVMSETSPTTASFYVVASARMATPVTVVLTVPPDALFTVSPSTITLTSTSCCSPLAATKVTVSPVLDESITDLTTVSLQASIQAGSDAMFLDLAPRTLSVSVVPLGGLVAPAVVTVIKGQSASFTVTNSSVLLSPLTVRAQFVADGSAAASNVVQVTPAEFTVPPTETITVTYALDTYVTGPKDTPYPGGSIVFEVVDSTVVLAPVAVQLTEVNVATFTVTADTELTVEGGEVEFTFEVGSGLLFDVSVYLVGGTGTPVATFSASADASQSTSFTYTVPDDDVCGSSRTQVLSFNLVSADLAYNDVTQSFSLSVADNDVPSWQLSTAVVEVTEGGNAVVDVTLTPGCKPAADVTVAVHPQAFPQYTMTPVNSVVLAGTNTPIVYTVAAVDDKLAEGDMSLFVDFDVTNSGPGPSWAAVDLELEIAITDNDVIGAVVTAASPLVLTEGGAGATFTVSLASKPYVGDVTVEPPAAASVILVPFAFSGHCVSMDDLVPVDLAVECSTADDCPDASFTCFSNTKVFTSPSELEFTSQNWDVPQTVFVTAFADQLVEGDDETSVSLQVGGTDAVGFAALAVDPVEATIADANDAGIVVAPVDGSGDVVILEGDGAAIGVKLLGQPHRPVVVGVDVSIGGRVEVSMAELEFTALNWNIVQEVRVTAIDDAVAHVAVASEPVSVAVLSTPSLDASYAALAADAGAVVTLSIDVVDNDQAGITMTRVLAEDAHSVVCQSLVADILTDEDCELGCTADDGSLSSDCPTSFCSCIGQDPESAGLFVGKGSVRDTVRISATSELVDAVTVVLVSSIGSGVNDTVDPCVGQASGDSVTWPRLLFDPSTVTLDADTPFVDVAVVGFDNFMIVGEQQASVSLTVSSADPLYNTQPGTAACAGVDPATLPSGAVQCPAPALPTVSATVIETVIVRSTLTSAKVSDDLTSILVTFSGQTNGAGKSGVFACSEVLTIDVDDTTSACSETVNAVTALGPNAVCAFFSSEAGQSSMLRIQLGAGSDPAGKYIRLLPTVRTTDSDSQYILGKVPVEDPTNPQAPVIGLLAPSQVSSCQGISIAGTLTGGGPNVLLTWSLVSITMLDSSAVPAGKEDAIIAALSSFTQTAITLADTLVPAGSVVVVRLTAQNPYLSTIATATITKSEQTIPVVRSDSGTTVNFIENDEVLIRGSVLLGPCLDPGTPLSIFWLDRTGNSPSGRFAAVQTGYPDEANWNSNGYTVLDTLTVNKRNFRNKLYPAGTYGLSLCAAACPAGLSCQSACEDITMIVARPALVVQVNSQLPGASIPLNVNDLSLTVTVTDNAISPPSAGTRVESWTCSGSCVISSTGAGTASVTGVSADNSYTFTYSRTDSLDSRPVTFAGTLSIIQGPSVVLSVLGGKLKFDPNEEVTIVATVTGDARSTKWSCPTCDRNFKLGLLNSNYDGGALSAYTYTSANMIKIASNAASGGSSATFVYSASGPGGNTRATVTIQYKSPPSCLFGTNNAEPYTFFAYGCQGATAFQFGQRTSTGTELLLGVASSNPVFTFSSIAPGDITVFCIVYGDGATTTVSTTVTVPEPVDPDTGAASGALGNALSEGDASSAQQAFLLLLSYIDLLNIPGGRRLTATDAAVISNRTAIIQNLPALGSLLENSADSTAARLGYIVTAVQHPGEVSVEAAVFAADYTQTVLDVVVSNSESFPSSSASLAVSVVSWLALCTRNTSAGATASDYHSFMATWGVPILETVSLYVAAGQVSGQSRTLLSSPDVTLAVANIDATASAAAYTASSITVPTNVQSSLASSSQTAEFKLRPGFGAALNAAASVNVATFGVGELVYTVLPYETSVFSGVTVATPMARLAVLTPGGVSLHANNIGRPVKYTLPLLNAVASSASVNDTSLSLQCLWVNSGVATRSSCISAAADVTTTAMSCYCDAVGVDVVGALVAKAAVLLQQTGTTTALQRGSLSVAEAGATSATYDVVLNSPPAASVTVTLSLPQGYCVNTTSNARSYNLPCASDADCVGTSMMCLTPALATVSPSTITFTTSNWNTPVTVTVTAIDDSWNEPGFPYGVITHRVSSTDLQYDAVGMCVDYAVNGTCTRRIGMADVTTTVNVTDNDPVGVVLSSKYLSVVEGGASTTFTVALQSKPFGVVYSALTFDATQLTVSPSSFWFSASNYSAAQTVTIAAPQDYVVQALWRNITLTQTLTSASGDYNGKAGDNVTVGIQNIDVAALRVNGTNLRVEENGAAAWYSLVLTAMPSASVKVTIADTPGLVISPVTVTFLRSKWNVPIPVYVTALSNQVAEGNRSATIEHSTSSLDAAFNVLNSTAVDSVSVSMVDNTVAGLMMSTATSPLLVAEGSVVTYTLKLKSQPVANVTVTLSAVEDDGTTPTTLVTVSPATVTFTASNWFKAVTATVTGVEDQVARPTATLKVKHTLASDDQKYSGSHLTAAVSVQEVDNDVAGVTVTPSTLSLIEGDSTVAESNGTFTVKLTSKPLANVVVGVTAGVGAAARLQFWPASLTFTDTNWNVAQTVLVHAYDDDITQESVQGVSIAVGISSSSDGVYNALSASLAAVNVYITNADGAAVLVSEGEVAVDEAALVASAKTYTLRLLTGPASAVTVTLSSAGLGSQFSVTPTTITFSTSNWATPQTVTVSALHDDVYRGATSNSFVLQHTTSSSAPSYNGLSVANVSVVVTEADAAGLTLTYDNSGTTFTALAGSWLAAGVVLTSKPLATVTVHATSSRASTLVFTPASLTFTASNWNVQQTVNVSTSSGATLPNVPITVTVSFTADSTDVYYLSKVKTIDLCAASGLHSTPVVMIDSDISVVHPSVPMLSADSSYDPDGTDLTYLWEAADGNSGIIASPITASTAVTGLGIGKFTFKLTVINENNVAATQEAIVWSAGFSTQPAVMNVTSGAAASAQVCFIGQSCVVGWTAGGLNGANTNTTVTGTSTRTGTFVIGSLVLVSASSFNWSVPLAFSTGELSVQVTASTRYPAGTSPLTQKITSDYATVSIQHPFVWKSGEYGNCSATCGNGVQTRVVVCTDKSAGGKIVSDQLCAGVSVKPTTSTSCFAGICGGAEYGYYSGDFGACSVECGFGTQTRTVECRNAAGAAVASSFCDGVNAVAPASSQSCYRGVCETFSLSYSPYGACSVSCGGGNKSRTVSCVSNGGRVVPLSRCSGTPEDLTVACNTAACATLGRWTIESDWTPCSAACGGGTSTRQVQCSSVTNGASIAATNCAPVTAPESTRACGTAPCTKLSYSVGAWGDCNRACQGNRTRELSCVSTNANTGVATFVSVSQCAAAGLKAPAITEVCGTECSFCDTTSCSFHGTCVPANSSCTCVGGYTGTFCESPPGCAGPMNKYGDCCGANSVLDANDNCCTGASAKLDAQGACCVSGSLNACGECDVHPSAKVAADGQCCESGVLEASGLCCVSGKLDSFGVCDGIDASGKQTMDMTLGAVGSCSDADIADVTSQCYADISDSIEANIAGALDRDPNNVQTTGVTVNSRRRVLFTARRATTGTLSASVELLPYGGPNNMPLYVLQSALDTYTSTSPDALFQLQAVNSAGVAAVCGNNLCEVGERPDLDHNIAGCAADCPYPIVTCPAANGYECNGVGVCVAGAGGVGTCVCWSSGGYGGDACDVCGVGFVAGSGGSCQRVESQTVVIPSGSSSSNAGLIGGVVAGGCVALIIGGLLYKFLSKKVAPQSTYSLKSIVKPSKTVPVEASRVVPVDVNRLEVSGVVDVPQVRRLSPQEQGKRSTVHPETDIHVAEMM